MKLKISGCDLSSERNFTDAVIGCLLLTDGHFGSHAKIAEMTSFTERRIRQAAERLTKAERLVKINNFIIPDLPCQGDKQAINRFRADVLLRFHGIRTPDAVCYRQSWLLALYGPNFYCQSIDVEERGIRLTPGQEKSRFIRIATAARYNLWIFNPKVYTFTDYLNDHGFKHT
jgi:hypothetical protein